MAKERKGYPSDVSDEEWEFCAPYLTLMKVDAPQRKHALGDLFNGLRWFIRAGCPWRMLPNDLPPWQAVQQQTERWLAEGLRLVLRLGEERGAQPSAASFDSPTLQSTPESGARAGYDGAKQRKGSKVHVAVDSVGLLLALKVTPALSLTGWHGGRLGGCSRLRSHFATHTRMVSRWSSGGCTAVHRFGRGFMAACTSHVLRFRRRRFGFLGLGVYQRADASAPMPANKASVASNPLRRDRVLMGFIFIVYCVLL